MKLIEYNNFADKDRIFRRITIDNTSEVDKMVSDLEAVQKETPLLFRGVSEAKYKTYSSAQRAWITKELSKTGVSFDDFIDSLINNVKHEDNNLLQRYFKSFGIQINDFLILSFLQHYGGPSPLIDLSYSLKNSLFFCFDNIKYLPSDNEIDNYASLYVFDAKYVPMRNELVSLDDFINQSIENANRVLEQFNQENKGKIKVDTRAFKSFINKCPYREYSATKMILVNGIENNNNVKRNNRSKFPMSQVVISNLNLIAQNGAFLFYSGDEQPLEDFYANNDIFNLRKITCYDIHKSLNNYITDNYLTPSGINHSTIYPEEEILAKSSLTMFLSKMK